MRKVKLGVECAERTGDGAELVFSETPGQRCTAVITVTDATYVNSVALSRAGARAIRDGLNQFLSATKPGKK